ncbi:MAG: hypothetical protein RR630_00955 [Coprobacillus sp.]
MIFEDRLYKIDMFILAVLSYHDANSETLTTNINHLTHQLFELKDGIVFSHLHYLEKGLLISQYQRDEDVYYHIESAGKVRLDMLKRQYYKTINEIDNLLSFQEDSYE